MSTRHIRKLVGGNSLPPPDNQNDSDEDFQPMYARESTTKFKFLDLVSSSHSESEPESNEVKTVAVSENSKKKKKKKNKKKNKPHQLTVEPVVEENINMDEIDKIVDEVNAILGSPSTPTGSKEAEPEKFGSDVMTLCYKHLNVANEMKRLYGTEAEENRRGRPQRNVLLKKVIVPVQEDFFSGSRGGVSMSLQRTENNFMYFTFDHSKEYQKIHIEFLQRSLSWMVFETAKTFRHVEALLETADATYRSEHYETATRIVSQVIAAMQLAAHPSFNLSNPKVRLEYKYLENRAFHVALLKYMYTLTNKACHRTALELAKLLMNLDPTDPLAVVFVIDVLALRARQHHWFIQAFEKWTVERDAGFLFNMRYSYALSHYHIVLKNKEDMAIADDLLQDALMRFPIVAVKILQYANMPLSTAAAECPLFKNAEKTSGKNLKDLIGVYGKLIWSWWREPGVMEWLKENMDRLAARYDNPEVQKRCKDLENERLNLFHGCPEQIERHLIILQPMSTLLLDEATILPRVANQNFLSYDPLPPSTTIDRYNYYAARLRFS